MVESKPSSLSFDPGLATQLQLDIIQEVYRAAKIPESQLIRACIRPVVTEPTRRFSELMAAFDQKIGLEGTQEASIFLLDHLTESISSIGEDKIPLEGPAIIASNHPGTYDGLTILSQIPRKDVKLIVSGIPFFKNFPNGSQHLIFATHDQQIRVDVIRKAVRHLQAGGLLLVFPSGQLDPDPAILPGAADNLSRWSKSLAVFLQKVQSVRLVLAITSGVVSKKFTRHPLLKFFKNGHEKRRMMEFLQVLDQMALNRKAALNPAVSFMPEDLQYPDFPISHMNFEKRMVLIRNQAEILLRTHMRQFYP